MYNSLSEFIKKLEENQELLRITEFTNPNLEITEITDRISKQPNGGEAILFENTGTNFPVLTNAMGSDKRISLAFGVPDLNYITKKINLFLNELTSPKASFGQKISALGSLSKLSGIFPKTIKTATCQEIIHRQPDINILPVLRCWPDDGGKFITLPIVHTVDPLTNIRNVGMYRMQVFDGHTTGMHWHKHKVGARHYAQYKELKQKMPVAVALGGDPVYAYSATAPMPDHIDEYLLAGFIRNKKVKLVKCITQDIEVPADADIIIEGYVDPNEALRYEGPFGDHTGFYSLADYYPAFHITCITHKQNAIYPATIVGVPPQEDAYIAKATEHIFLPPMQKSIAPEILEMHMPEAGVAHNFTMLKIKPLYEGHALKIMNSMWGAGQMSLNKFLFITDDHDTQLSDYKAFIKKSLTKFNPLTDIYYGYGPLDVLDHAAEKFTLGSKIGFDFTLKKNIEEEKIKKRVLNLDEVKSNFDEITEINSLLNKEIPIIIFSVDKKEKIKLLTEKIIEKHDFSSYKIIIFVDKKTDISNLYYVSWICGNNIAPRRDTFISQSNKFRNNLFIADATTKTQHFDNFEREWPDFVKMNQETIKKIDENWQSYHIGKFIESPSKKIFKI